MTNSLSPTQTRVAVAELVLAGVFWGFGFVATIWVLPFLAPASLLCARFGIAFVLGFLILFLQKKNLKDMLNDLKLSFLPAILLWATLFLQVTGLTTTSATNSSFITTLYVIIVPILQSFRGKEKMTLHHWFYVAIAMIGTLLIVNLQNSETLNKGDALTLICAFTAAIHILLIDARTSRVKNDFQFNVFQSGWLALLCLLFIPAEHTAHWKDMTTTAWLGLGSLAIGSSLIAFFLQVKAQRTLPASVASVLFLLESPFACFLAFLFLHERLSWQQWVGACLILIACVCVSLKPKLKTETA